MTDKCAFPHMHAASITLGNFGSQIWQDAAVFAKIGSSGYQIWRVVIRTARIGSSSCQNGHILVISLTCHKSTKLPKPE